jgi:hypothetical protein
MVLLDRDDLMKGNNMSDKMSAIDQAIAKAKEKAAARKAGKASTAPEAPVKAKASKSSPVKKDVDDKEAVKAAREKERTEAKEKRDAEREAKKAEKLAARKPAHMSKVLKAAEKLPTLSADAELVFSDATSNLPAAMVAALSLHLQHFNRVKATERAMNAKIEEGDEVEIIGGDPRFIGKVGTVVKAGRLRCHVEVEGLDKNVYCFTSDVAPAEVANEEATGTEG